jgi:hypothetical protein
LTDLDQKLASARDLYRAGNYKDRVFADLAVANYQPAKALFEEMLDDANEEVRYMTLSRLVRMEGLDADEKILKRAREIVVDDPDDLCRGAAAVILGANSKWPDSALERAIGAEADAATRQTMFLAILRLLVSWDFADQMVNDVEAGKVDLTLESALALAAKEKGGTKAGAGKAAARSGTKKKLETLGRAGKTADKTRGRTGKPRKK